ncbi:hypothetical protein ACPUVO_17860 [Pseudocolwellia sp. HL-MZ19]|uniref:hypothetical protein n=1 Tax=Pseudocolwellia sp. HL-MZ19 TaxID=3400846 RepID=UPI003CF7326D
MSEQVSLWKGEQQTSDFSEFCNALYERELHSLANMDNISIESLQGRLKSLPYYINRTAHSMMQCSTPLMLDIQNASWSAKQGTRMPISDQDESTVSQWYAKVELKHGLVVPIVHDNHIALDSIDRVDLNKQRFRTNVHGWFSFNESIPEEQPQYKLLKPNKRVMTAACAGHCWVNDHKSIPVMPSLRELLISCTVNWSNFKKPIIL